MFQNTASALPYQMSDLPTLCTAVAFLARCFVLAHSVGMYQLESLELELTKGSAHA